MNKLERVNEMRAQLAALEAEIEAESKVDKWEPEGTFRMTGSGSVYVDDPNCFNYAKYGNVRATSELAERAIKRRLPRDLIAAYVDQYAPDYEPDWSDGSANKCAVVYNHESAEWLIAFNLYVSSPNEVYMPQELAEQLIADIKSGRVDLGYPINAGDL